MWIAVPSDLVSEVVKAAGEAIVIITSNLVDKTIVEGLIPAKWELSTIMNCWMGKGYALEKEKKYREGLKLPNSILKINERVT